MWRREKLGKCKRRKKKGERKVKIGNKKVKLMQNKDELRQKGHNRSQKRYIARKGKISFSKGEGRINILFGPQY